MANPTSNIESRRARRGYTLVEAMLASVLLSVTVVTVSGAISSSYAQESYATQRYQAMQSGMQLLDEVSALPMDPVAASDPSMMGYHSYSDEAPIDELRSVMAGGAAPAASTTEVNARRAISVQRSATLNGAPSPTGDFSLVSVQVQNGGQTVTLKRLVTSAESKAKR